MRTCSSTQGCQDREETCSFQRSFLLGADEFMPCIFLGVDFSISWIFTKVEIMFPLSQCHRAAFSACKSAVRSP